jgi:uncharacterized cupin superfamily protein
MLMTKARRSALAAAVCSLACLCAQAQTQTQTTKPVKFSKADLGGAVFNRKDAQKSVEGGTQMTDVVGFTSPDKAYQTGVFKSGPSHEVIKGPQGLAYTEFLYFLSGGVKLTSSDGSVLNVGTGEAVTLPKGWTGQFDTEGYTKLYVTYSPDDAKQ